jgi:DNA-binding transcriptional regulator YiaG
MIRTDKEYKAALQKLRQNKENLTVQREHFVSMHLSEEQIELGLSPLLNFYYQIKDEVEAYERIKNRDWDFIYKLADFHSIGQLFIALRIAYGLTQRDFAKVLGVTEAQVSKDERNEYHGISLERAMRIMEILRIIPQHLQVDTNLNRESLIQLQN